MASVYLPTWLHLPSVTSIHIPSVQAVEATFYKPVPAGYAALATAGVISASYVLRDIYRYYFLVKQANRGTNSANPAVYILGGIIRLWRYVRGMDGASAKPIYKAVRSSKVALYKKKLFEGSELPVRRGPRPDVLIQRPASSNPMTDSNYRGVPHRQIPQVLDSALNAWKISSGILQPLTFRRLPSGPPKSRLEPHALAVFLSPTVSPNHPDLAPQRNIARVSSLEFAHCHESENSLHLVLSPLDCAEAIEKGWAVRFPLAGTCIPYADQPLGKCMIYAPRDMEEVKVIRVIVEKSMQWMMCAP